MEITVRTGKIKNVKKRLFYYTYDYEVCTVTSHDGVHHYEWVSSWSFSDPTDKEVNI